MPKYLCERKLADFKTYNILVLDIFFTPVGYRTMADANVASKATGRNE